MWHTLGRGAATYDLSRYELINDEFTSPVKLQGGNTVSRITSKGKMAARRVISKQEEEDFDLDALVMNANSITSSRRFVRNQRDTELVKVLKSDGTGFEGGVAVGSVSGIDGGLSQGTVSTDESIHDDGNKRINNKHRSGATFKMLELKKMFVRTDLQPEAGIGANSSGACCDDYHTYLYHGRRYILPSPVEAKEPKHFNGGVGMVSNFIMILT